MKKVINGKLYDTETAREVGSAQGGGQSFRDFHFWRETLYCKRTGEYFLHGEGGPLTQYAEWIDNHARTGGERIVPMDYNAAREWAEKNMDTDDYEEEFGEVAEDDSATVLSISIPASVADKARRAAREAGMSLSGYIASLINA